MDALLNSIFDIVERVDRAGKHSLRHCTHEHMWYGNNISIAGNTDTFTFTLQNP